MRNQMYIYESLFTVSENKINLILLWRFIQKSMQPLIKRAEEEQVEGERKG